MTIRDRGTFLALCCELPTNHVKTCALDKCVGIGILNLGVMVKKVHNHLMGCAKFVGMCTFLEEKSCIFHQILKAVQDPKDQEP